MTIQYLLDTTIVSAPVLKAPNPRILSRLELHGSECAIAAPVWHELAYGCQRLPEGKRRSLLEAYIHDVVEVSFQILPYDAAAAAWHARERARLETLGRPAPYADAQIAAIAHANGLVLVTTNTKDFSRYKDLALADWSK